MSIVVSASELKGVVKRVAVAGGEKTVFNFHDGEVGSSNLALSIITKFAAIQAGDVNYTAVDTKLLREITSKLKKGDVELRVEYDKSTMIITSDKATFTLPTSQVSAVTIQAPEQKIMVPRAAFIELLAFAANAAESKQRFNYTGSIDIRPYGPKTKDAQTIVAVGTNGCCLAVGEAMLPILGQFGFLLPVQTLKALQELAGSDLNLSQTDTAIFIESSSTRIMASKTTKQFPAFDKFLIAEPKFQAEIKAALMREALDKVSPMIDHDNKAVLLQFSEGRLTLTTGTGLTGKATDVLDFEGIVPDPVMDAPATFQVRLNHTYLRDFFADAKGTVTFTATTSSQPVWLSCEGKRLLAATVSQ